MPIGRKLGMKIKDLSWNKDLNNASVGAPIAFKQDSNWAWVLD